MDAPPHTVTKRTRIAEDLHALINGVYKLNSLTSPITPSAPSVAYGSYAIILLNTEMSRINAAGVSACPTQPGSDSGAASSCDCWSATFRMVSLRQRASGSPLSVPKTGGPLLADTLDMARHLVQHWSTLNGCANSESHMTVQTLCSMADAIDLVLRDHEKAAEEQAHPQRQAHIRTYVGRLELDTAEAAIVAQEALKHSLIRLTAMLQDIEEEAALLSQSNDENPLRQKDIKDLITRLFRLLGNVNRLATT